MKTLIALPLSLLLLSGCSLIPDFQTPTTEMPSAWSESSATESSAIARTWWTGFGSQELDRLMDEALANNNDLLASVQRIEQARALLGVSESELLPSADATASLGRERTTRPDSTDTNMRIGAGVSYELDLFGLNRANVEQSEAELEASTYDHEALRLVVMADVARTYFSLLNARERLRIADSNLDNSREVLRIVQARFDAGASDALEVAQQKSQLATTEAARASVQESIKNAENALAVLIGKPPQTVGVETKNLAAIDIPVIAAGQPSELLQRRPDIQSAEAKMRAANADIGAARAAMFPNVTLGLDGSLAKAGLGDPTATALGITSSLLQPIFEGGRLESVVTQRTALREELVQRYRKTILVSFQEVEDALAAVKASQARETALQTAMNEARRFYDLSRSRYDAGTIDFQTLMDAQRQLLASEDAFAQSKNERLSAAVGLFKALGGGWSQKST